MKKVRQIVNLRHCRYLWQDLGNLFPSLRS